MRRHTTTMATKPKRPRDVNQLAHMIMKVATGDASDLRMDSGKNAAAVALGRLGGLKGGKARAASMSPEQRSEIASLAAKKRWGK